MIMDTVDYETIFTADKTPLLNKFNENREQIFRTSYRLEFL